MALLTLGRQLDLGTLADTGVPATLQADALTRHAVCVGMTGSGKTGLCIGLLESLASAGVPVLALDPKGDLANLALVRDRADAAAFLPWMDPVEAERRGCTLEVLAEEAAERRAGELAGVPPERLARWRERVEVVVHTPGSESGVPIDVLTGLIRAPPGLEGDAEGLREYVTGAVSALLGLVGPVGDALTDPRAILLARILGDAFAVGQAVPLDVLVTRIVDPPFDALGYFAVEEVIPREERQRLALDLNNVAASPAFQGWLRGVPLDVRAWLAPTASGRTPLRVLTFPHLDDRQRQFFVTLILHAVVAWTRSLPGTSALRAVLFFDEVMGYLPPHPKDPPSKAPILTLMKQARAVGMGVVLSTQNPVDLDYKALSNAATWWVGRLQTRQDRQRVVDGLVAAVGEADASQIGKLLGRLPQRAFAWRTADDPGARVLRSRQAMSWLRGPLTRQEIAKLGQTWDGPASIPDGLLGEAPSFPEDVPVRWLLPEGCAAVGVASDGAVWDATLYGRFRVVYASAGEERTVHRWLRGEEAEAVALEDGWLARRAPAGGRYRPVAGVIRNRSEVVRTRSRWWEEVRAEAVIEVAGRRVRAEREDVTVVGWAVVWVPTA